MTTRGYTILGWITWQIAKWFARRKLRENRVRIGAVAVIVLVLLGGIAVARASSED